MSSTATSKLKTINNEVEQLHPLLSKLLPKIPDVLNVEYTHGIDEFGADFVLSKRNNVFDTIDYIGVIAKVGRIIQDFTNIEKQIDECSMPRPFLGGKEKVLISEIWIIVTEHITNNAQWKINHKYETRKIYFVDGNKLEEWINKYLPNYWYDMGLEIGEYLKQLKQQNYEIDQSVSLLPVSMKDFYIEQDIYELEDVEYSQKRKYHKSDAGKIDIIDKIDNQKIIFIEGGMGAGKSKLFRHLVDYYSKPEIYTEKKYIPITTEYKFLVDKFSCNIRELINSKVAEKIQISIENKTYLLFIDAVDEKDISSEEQLKFLNKIIKYIYESSDIKAVIASRHLKELETSVEINKNIFWCEIRPLSLNKTFEFVKTICKELNIADRIIEDIRKSQLFKELPKSPISAILLAKLLNENSKDLPSNLTELYSKYMELMLGRWDIEKGLQSQKEYQALDNIMMDLSKYLIENEIPRISIEEAKVRFENYLKVRNLEIQPSQLFDKMRRRCDILICDEQRNIIGFKHRTFAEYFYAKSLCDGKQLKIDNRVFSPYWMNTYFFYLGIQKDCPDQIQAIISLVPKTEPEKWLKLVNMSNYLLAAYATPYDVITKGIMDIMIEAAELYNSIITGKIISPFSELPQMHLLWLMQLFIRSNYSFNFFKNAMEESVLKINEEVSDKEIKLHSIFFLNAAYISTTKEENFDFLLKGYIDNLPIDLALAIDHEAKDFKTKSLLLKKHQKNLSKIIRNSSSLRYYAKNLYDLPINRALRKEST